MLSQHVDTLQPQKKIRLPHHRPPHEGQYKAGGMSQKFTNHCVGRFYQNNTLDAATAAIERGKKLNEKKILMVEMQKKKLDDEVTKIKKNISSSADGSMAKIKHVEEVQKKIKRQKQREARRILSQRIRAAVVIQTSCRAYIQKKKYHSSQKKISHCWMRYILRNQQKKAHEKDVSLFLQKICLRRICRVWLSYQETKTLQKVDNLQCFVPSRFAKPQEPKKIIQLNGAATRIQKKYRGYQDRESLRRMNSLAIVIQKKIRSYLKNKTTILKLKKQSFHGSNTGNALPLLSTNKVKRITSRSLSFTEKNEANTPRWKLPSLHPTSTKDDSCKNSSKCRKNLKPVNQELEEKERNSMMSQENNIKNTFQQQKNYNKNSSQQKVPLRRMQTLDTIKITPRKDTPLDRPLDSSKGLSSVGKSNSNSSKVVFNGSNRNSSSSNRTHSSSSSSSSNSNDFLNSSNPINTKIMNMMTIKNNTRMNEGRKGTLLCPLPKKEENKPELPKSTKGLSKQHSPSSQNPNINPNINPKINPKINPQINPKNRRHQDSFEETHHEEVNESNTKLQFHQETDHHLVEDLFDGVEMGLMIS